mmetsp:Transcript_99674/g.253385  ORF Transcript_99674/g.253385 Transcript_99674/m.253385 type:complete len:354 (+) Transcript_99674:339-1400(+)
MSEEGEPTGAGSWVANWMRWTSSCASCRCRSSVMKRSRSSTALAHRSHPAAAASHRERRSRKLSSKRRPNAATPSAAISCAASAAASMPPTDASLSSTTVARKSPTCRFCSSAKALALSQPAFIVANASRSSFVVRWLAVCICDNLFSSRASVSWRTSWVIEMARLDIRPSTSWCNWFGSCCAELCSCATLASKSCLAWPRSSATFFTAAPARSTRSSTSFLSSSLSRCEAVLAIEDLVSTFSISFRKSSIARCSCACLDSSSFLNSSVARLEASCASERRPFRSWRSSSARRWDVVCSLAVCAERLCQSSSDNCRMWLCICVSPVSTREARSAREEPARAFVRRSPCSSSKS